MLAFAPSAVMRKEEGGGRVGKGKRRSVKGEGAEEVDMGEGDVGYSHPSRESVRRDLHSKAPLPPEVVHFMC